MTGKKVVLVDMDLNNPTQAKILNCSQGRRGYGILNGRERSGRNN